MPQRCVTVYYQDFAAIEMLEEIYNFLQLSDRLATSGQPTEEQFQEIVRAGYEVVINLGLARTDYALEDEAGLVHSLGMNYVHIPVIWENPTLENFDEFTSMMEEHKGERLFVHCAANMRVSVFMALYRILHLGWERERAMEDVHKIWDPNERWDKFITKVLGLDTVGGGFIAKSERPEL
jgi:protein tyrosine phosphatase (PTP) superfamily phosphohydrolase (DUF442 family)